MKPALHNYLLAHTATFSAAIGVLAALGLLFFTLHDEGALTTRWPMIGWIILAAIPIGAIGYIVGVVFIWMMLGGIAARIQGWPFKKEEEVVILAGKNKGTVARIYEVWECRGQVRLELGEDARKAVTDVYCAVAVTRSKTQNQPCVATGDRARG